MNSNALLFLGQDYAMAIAVVFLAILAGMVVICVPRPRRKYFTEIEEVDLRMKKVNRKRPTLSPQQLAQKQAMQQQSAQPQMQQQARPAGGQPGQVRQQPRPIQNRPAPQSQPGQRPPAQRPQAQRPQAKQPPNPPGNG